MRVDRARINKRTVEALIKAGAFDSLQLNRASLIASVDRAFDFANATEANANQGGLFDMGDSHAASTQEPPLVEATPWGVKERLTFEKTASASTFRGIFSTKWRTRCGASSSARSGTSSTAASRSCWPAS